jgi:hypothetical protein
LANLGTGLTVAAGGLKHAGMAKFEIVGVKGEGMFVVVDGVRIAKRGAPGTPAAGTRVTLVAGWQVTQDDASREIIVSQTKEILH